MLGWNIKPDNWEGERKKRGSGSTQVSFRFHSRDVHAARIEAFMSQNLCLIEAVTGNNPGQEAWSHSCPLIPPRAEVSTSIGQDYQGFPAFTAGWHCSFELKAVKLIMTSLSYSWCRSNRHSLTQRDTVDSTYWIFPWGPGWTGQCKEPPRSISRSLGISIWLSGWVSEVDQIINKVNNLIV